MSDAPPPPAPVPDSSTEGGIHIQATESHSPKPGNRSTVANLRTPNASPSLSRRSIKSPDLTPRVMNLQEKESVPPNSEKVEHQSVFPSIDTIPFPQVKEPSKCPLFCCFFAEFDDKVGPRICYQSPRKFMEQDINMSLTEIHAILHDGFAELSGEKTNDEVNGENHPDENTASDTRLRRALSTDTGKSVSSVFESCGEFIITGKELCGNIINLSTHHIHILTRPTLIADERYQRNSLLFSVGFILRRSEDPRPFRSVLSKVALTLRDMEQESQFLSSPASRDQIEILLDHIMMSLNSNQWECNILLNSANLLSLKLFHPPKNPSSTVPEYAVPILLRREWQVQSYEWDLAINWVSLHIDGCSTARLIAKRAEVDMEMVQACLRVLKHHGVIALIDMFFFSNRYESTEAAARIMQRKNDKVIVEAVEYVSRRNQEGTERSPSLHSTSSFGDTTPERPRSVASSYPPEQKDMSAGSFRFPSLTSTQSNDFTSQNTPLSAELIEDLKFAISELYIVCSRDISSAELWAEILSGKRTLGGRDRDFWNKIFYLIDHRRFASFGVVRGLLKRVHMFPVLVESRRRNDYGYKYSDPVAELMDGKHCDDHLSTMFQRPINDLLDSVGRDNVVCVFS